mmetsp:Transcript_29317/g.64917  ORF Transcript_29317/g.64917 Transcript_29317/m.64917 type:complete len:374 (+) Transcript_29317:87-1208(+)|eukprot:CAMPEP_0202906040 /NCGR_PEP_ID=MMETSP1392-20130828/37124_1 /ASSEMBLY_ACC=CAM_ASM_000868 /TAXON_ID=225041 /ORGANISM="Chlamydomonas chlamydogama, Strain SAG 11-48b" /LENGTH=373 /DNA_ID=CAMNT_0049594391 /DNA_START=14 /DNA_END=1135 /DNA_ORIENTATION=-
MQSQVQRAVSNPGPNCQLHIAQRNVRNCTTHRLTCQGKVPKRTVSCSAAQNNFNSDSEDLGTPVNASPAARRLYTDLQKTTPVGSEWGEGFLQFRPGEPLRLDVDTLNERLQHQGATRHRHVHKPDEASGLIFSFDGCIANTRAALVRAWAQLGKRHGCPPLLTHQQQALGLRSTSPERAILDVLGWTRDLKQARALAWELAELHGEELKELSEPMPGLREWLMAVANYNVPCAVVSSLDKHTVQRSLERMGLHDYFNVMVTADDDMETLSQRFLSAAMQLHRPPNLCVVFDDSPQGITAAHNCTMKAVAVRSAYPAYSLKQADLTVTKLSDLTVYNIRRLFAQQGSEFMAQCKQRDDDSNNNKKKKITSATL